MRLDDFGKRVSPVGVLYVDVHPFAWQPGGEPEFLILKRRPDVRMPGQWQTVSGKLVEDERIVDGFVRQLFQKSGLQPVQLFKLSTVATFFDEYYDTVMFVPNAIARVDKLDPTLDLEIHDEFRWVTLEEALSLLAWPTQRLAVESISTDLAWHDGVLSARLGQFSLSELVQ